MSDLTIRSRFAKTLTLLALVSASVGALILTAVHGQNSTAYSAKLPSTRTDTASSWLLAATNYEGFVDAMDCGVIRGWAADRNRLNTSINVRIYDGNTLVRNVPANLFRQDVANHLHDNGLHGFNIPTPASLKTGQHTVSVRFENNVANLSQSPQTLACTNYKGSVNALDCGVIRGWAADRNRPDTAISVQIYDGNTLVTTVLANLFRQSAADQLHDNGLHGFNIPTPAGFQNGVHTVSVKFENSTTNLNHSPKTIDCGPVLVGAYYFAGWWRGVPPLKPPHYLTPEVPPVDWREGDYSKREPTIGWLDDRQQLVDREITLAAGGGLDFFVFDYFTKTAQDPPRFPGANANNNNGLKFFLTSPNKSLMSFAITYINDEAHAIKDLEKWGLEADKWVQYFGDCQYLKIDGRPVFFINAAPEMGSQWNTPANPHHVEEVLQILRDKAVAAGFPGVLISGGLPSPTPSAIAFRKADGYDFFTAYSGGFDQVLRRGEHDYKELLAPPGVSLGELSMPDTWNIFLESNLKPYAPVVVQGWDRTPLRKDLSDPDKPPEVYYVNQTPQLFQKQLRLARNFVDENPSMRVRGQRLVVIYAWNEIGEGGELMPTKTEKSIYLNQVRKVFR